MDPKFGKFGKPTNKSYAHLPANVRYHIDRFKNPELDADWAQFKAEDDNIWMVARTWDDKDLFTISACVIKWEDFFEVGKDD